MDEGLLNDLLECSVCLERLDTSSRVLPCQHTFCLKCLKVIVESHKELRCPECRVLVEAKVEELPPNVLLMRILEGMRNSAPRKQGGTHRALRTGHTLAAQSGQQSRCDLKQLPPHARAMYDYISKEQGDLSFKKGETIMLQKKLDPYWYQGECAGRTGVFPITYVQVVVPLQIPTALCKALYDFRMSAPDEEGCLAFDKGAIITVHRRVDENWAEGRLEQRVGIFPIAFVELNQAARQLMNSVPLNRAVPPVPEHARPGHSDHRQEHRHHTQHAHRYTPMSASMPTEQPNYQNMSAMSQSQPTTFASLQPVLVPQVQGSVSAGLVTVQRNILEPSTKHSLDLIQFTGKATVGLQSVARINEHYDRVRAGKVEFSAVEPSDSSSATTATPNSSSGSSSSSTCASLAASPDAPAATHTSLNVSLPVELPDTTTRRHDKRHSLTNTHLTTTSNANANQNNQNRHSAEILATSLLDHSEPRERRRRRERSSERYLPATYIALYPYKPQKPDELELKKGGIYSVSSVCRDGWFKGWCARSQRGGVFPGNYVAPAPIANTATTNTATTNTATTNTATSNSATANTANSAAHSPAPASTPSNSSHHREKSQGPSSSGAAAPGSKTAAPPPDAPPRENSPHGQQPMSYPWNSQSQSQSQQSTPRSDKSKEKSRVEKSSISTGVSLMKRLAAMKKCKSPPPVGYSMDNPVFEDGPGTSLMLNLAAQHHPVHVRSGSCPSQLLRALPATTHSTHSAHTAQMAHSAQTGHSAAERRHKDRHHEHVLHRSNDGPWQSQHRKSQSLDVTATRRDRHHSQTVKERFRCIVPYPPNSEYELELKLDDIVIVSKKRGDGWYKGTLQRTGRTGLFPASFVQSCPQE